MKLNVPAIPADHLSADTIGGMDSPETVIESVPAADHRIRVDGKYFARGQERLRVQGVTYGPFAPNLHGEPYPSPERVSADFRMMRGLGINALRTYHAPPAWLLDKAEENRIRVLLDAPWAKHLCFLESASLQQEARRMVRQTAQLGPRHPSILAYSVGNEIPANIVRWHGARRIERFLAELCDVAKQADPDGLVTYANFPPTEYLDLSFLDFATFNVYLHDLETFRRYLFRLQNLIGDRPLVLGELGIDTLRHGEEMQAAFLAGHLRESVLMGLAGTFVFSWTDEWYTGGHRIENWSFGVTNAERSPKPACQALQGVFERSPAELLREVPRVSVVVCSYNGGATLDQCLRSLDALDYPDYEVILVDDGSTDDTRTIAARFPHIRAIHQPNRGLSAARNTGMRVATGSIVAYTDSDCFVDKDWLTHLVHQLERGNAAAVGGPNLAPRDGWLAACVAASPGQPMHVLESDQEAEHIPGCNMAFRRHALEAVGGFDPQYRKAGDDVDVCWRLQQAGYWITFAPGAFVWHHRRQTPAAYFRQQGGYGEAEALLRFKHPDRFTHRGDGKWRGVLYGASLQGLSVDEAIIYRGTFGTGLFQCIYQPGPSHWAMLPSTLEWHMALALLLPVCLFFPLIWGIFFSLWALSLFVAILQAAQARIAPEYDGPGSRLLVAALCYFQPLIRSFVRYRTRLLSYRRPEVRSAFPEKSGRPLSLDGTLTIGYWTEEGYERTELLGLAIAYLNEHGWGRTIDSGWKEWDLEIYCHPWTVVQVCTSQEDHGGKKRLLRVRYRQRLSATTMLIGQLTVLTGVVSSFVLGWPALAAAGAVVLGLGPIVWWLGTRRAAHAVALFEGVAEQLGLIPCSAASPSPRKQSVPPGGAD
jgi:cellulose synthase/poly-beta-1,6-N-acetylglucosamine synthase-like glycosyltransferase